MNAVNNLTAIHLQLNYINVLEAAIILINFSFTCNRLQEAYKNK